MQNIHMISSPGSSVATQFASNYLLASLPAANLERIAPCLTPCLLHLTQPLYERGEHVKEVYFPKNGVISLVLSSQTGIDVEAGIVGREGVVGGIEALLRSPMIARANVQIAGSGWKMSAQILREECQSNDALQTAIVRSLYSLSQQTAQCVLCNRLHALEKRLARWLLMCQDRMHTDTLELTHEFISSMLGTRRVGITLAAGVLRDAGLISYQRGVVTVLDRAGLEARACECYASIRQTFDEISPPHKAPFQS